MLRNPASTCFTLALLTGLAAAACNGGVEVQPPGTGGATGGSSSTSSSGGGVSSSSASSSSSSSSSSSGAGWCAPELPAGCSCPGGAAGPWTRTPSVPSNPSEATILPWNIGTLPVGPDGSVVFAMGTAGDSWLTKIDAAGEVVWQRSDLPWSFLGTPDPSDCSTLVTGWLENGQTTVDGQVFTCNTNHCPYVARLDAGGSLAWLKRYETEWGYLNVAGVTADGRIAVYGSTQAPIDLGDGPISPPAGGSAELVAQLSKDGDTLWSRHVLVAHDGSAADAVVSPAGDITMSATAVGGVDFGDGYMPSAQAGDYPSFVLVSYDSSGALRFGKMLGFGPYFPLFFVLAQSSAGNTIALGRMAGAMDFGGGPIGDPNAFDQTYVAAFDPAGNFLWNRLIGAAQKTLAIAVNAADHVWISFESGELIELGPEGDPLASYAIGGSGQRLVNAIGFAPDGAPIVTGTFDGTLDLGQGPLVAQGAHDPYIARLAP